MPDLSSEGECNVCLRTIHPGEGILFSDLIKEWRAYGCKCTQLHITLSISGFYQSYCVCLKEWVSLSLIKGRKGYDLNRGEDCHWLKDGGRPWVRSLTSQMTSLSKTNFFRHSKRTKWRTWHFANNTAGSHSLNVNIYICLYRWNTRYLTYYCNDKTLTLKKAPAYDYAIKAKFRDGKGKRVGFICAVVLAG